MNKTSFLAIDLGGTKTAIAIFKDGLLLGSSQFHTPLSSRDFELIAQSEIHLLLTRLDLDLSNLVAIGVAAAGYWEYQGQPSHYLLKQSIHLSKYIDEDLWGRLSASLSIPVYLASDVELAALGEALYGHNYDPLLYINLGTGFSAGLFREAQIFTNSYSPNLRLEYLLDSQLQPNLLSSRSSTQASRQELTKSLASILINLACILSPKAIVLGGGKTQGENWDLMIKPAIDKALDYLDEHLSYSIKIMRSKLENPSLYGAYQLALLSHQHKD